jgi:uncharacterized protein YndB with AHSA1/START domain
MARRQQDRSLGVDDVAADLTIQRDIYIDAPADVVFRTITEPESITQWFADRVELDVQPGATGVLVFETGGGTKRAAVTVETVDRPHRLSFRWGHDVGTDPSPSNSVLVQFTLDPEGDGTRLRVVESGLESTSWPAPERVSYADDHRRGWQVCLDRLAALLSTGAR